MRSLRERLVDIPQVGRVVWIGVRPEHGAALVALPQARAIGGLGLEGDIASNGRAGGKRQVTLFQAEHLPVLASFTGQTKVTPLQVRRNLVVEGVNLLSLMRLRFRIGKEVILVGTGPCAPCGKMDETIAPGGFQAMRGHGGITTSVEVGGVIRVGDEIRTV